MTIEPQPAASKPGRRPFQFSLRALFGLTFGTAAFFSLGRTLGYVDAVVILAGLGLAVAIMDYPRRVYPVTAIVLTFVTGTLLWANLRTPRMWTTCGGGIPAEWLDPVAQSMFSRGWPLAPFMVSLVHGMRFHSSEVEVYEILFLDGIVYMIALFAAKYACEFCLRKRDKWSIETPAVSSPSEPQVK